MKKRNLILAQTLSLLILVTPSFAAGEGQHPHPGRRSHQNQGDLSKISPEVLKYQVLPFLNHTDLAHVQQTCSATASTVPSALIKRRFHEEIMTRFRRQFVPIPAGKLPGDIDVAAFEMDKFPVTRELWNVIMGEMSEHVPVDQRENWNRQPRNPVTRVNWENRDGSRAEVQVFLEKLNQREAASGCTYDLPTDQQLWYSIRGDQTGLRAAKYSTAIDLTGALIEVNNQNVNQYVTHGGNSNSQIQPVGNKPLNAFGIELGNVWKMSKDIYDPAHPEWGRSVRGGSWNCYVDGAESADRSNAIAGHRHDSVGFSLVRTCH